MADGLEGLIGRITGALHALGRAHALVGGLAVSARTEPRFTRDVDVAVVVRDDADAEAMINDLRAYGFAPFAIVEHDVTGRLATVRLRTPDRAVVDLLLASTGIEDAVVATATPMVLVPGLVVPVAGAEHLAAMKVLSASEARPQDVADLRALWGAGLDAQVVLCLLRRIAEVGCDRGQDLVAKFEALVDARR